MIQVRRDEDIYRKEGGWFTARWHFSFDEYWDPQNMGFGALRVFNDDRLIPGAVWPMHPHRDIEGLTYVVEGAFRHADSLGNNGVLPAGSVQRMTLGSGALHSEQNGSETEPMRFIQMWIIPERRGLPPSVQQKVFTKEDRTNRLLEVIAPDGRNGAVKVHCDASVYVSFLEGGRSGELRLPAGQGAYLYLIEGEADVNGNGLRAGDAAKAWDEKAVAVTARRPSELIVVRVELPE
jgi:redox-sensitive bicupin YhaK (pirin superfamily)